MLGVPIPTFGCIGQRAIDGLKVLSLDLRRSVLARRSPEMAGGVLDHLP